MVDAHDLDLCAIVRGAPDSPAARAAFAELYSQHRDAAMAQAYRITGERDRAEDLVAEVFARVLRALTRGSGPRESVLGYIMIALRSEAIRAAEVASMTVPVAPETFVDLFDEGTADIAVALSEQDQIVRAFAQLSESAREALWLLDVEQVETERAAEHLEVSVGTLRVMAHRSRKKLATAYLQQYVEAAEPGCHEFASHLAEFTRGSLGRAHTRRVGEHVAGCAHCSSQLQRLGSLQSQLRSWVGPLLGAGGVGAAASVVGPSSSAEAATETGADAATSSVGKKVLAWLGLAAGVLLLIGGALTLLPQREDDPGSPVTVGTTVDDGQDEEAPPVEVDPIDGVEVDGSTTPPSISPAGAPVQDDTTPFWKLRP